MNNDGVRRTMAWNFHLMATGHYLNGDEEIREDGRMGPDVPLRTAPVQRHEHNGNSAGDKPSQR